MECDELANASNATQAWDSIRSLATRQHAMIQPLSEWPPFWGNAERKELMKPLHWLDKFRLFAFLVSCNGMAGILLAWLARGQGALARYAVGLGMCSCFLIPVYIFLVFKLAGRRESSREDEDEMCLYRMALALSLASLALGLLFGTVITPWF